MNEPTNPAHRGQTIRGSVNEWSQMRLDAKLSITDLAQRSGLPRSIVGLIDKGRFVPTPEQARKLMEACQS